MSRVVIQGDASGTGDFTIAAPNSNTDRTLTLPDEAGTVLTTSSTSVVTPAMLTQPLTSGTTVATTSGTSVDFTGIPSWVKHITIMVKDFSTNGASHCYLRIGSGSVATSGYLSAGGYLHSAGGSGITSTTTGFMLNNNIAASVVIHCIARLSLLDSSTNSWTFSSSGNRSDFVGLIFGSGSTSLGGALDRVRLTTANGTDTFDAGSINIVYE